MDTSIAVIGLGKLGLPIAACLASSGYEVRGYDNEPCHLSRLREAQYPDDEPEVVQRLEQNTPLWCDSISDALANSSLVMLVLPTPSTQEGRFSNSFLNQALVEVAQSIKESTQRMTVVIVSTVMPGSFQKEFIPTLEELSGKQVGDEFGLCYNPAFIALGSVVGDFLKPDLVLIGASDQHSADYLSSVYRQVCLNAPPLAIMDLTNAEVVKLALNSFVTMKISFANTLLQVCQNIPGGDVDKVTEALGLDSRIGGKYLQGSTAFGGPCFPRDSIAFGAMAEELGIDAPLARATAAVNEEQKRNLSQLVLQHSREKEPVAILGLAYKPGCAVLEESAGMYLAQTLQAANRRLVLFDPQAGEQAAQSLSATLAHTLEEVTSLAKVIVISTPDKNFLRLGQYADSGTIIDCWRLLASQELRPKVVYIPLGRNILEPQPSGVI